MICAFAYPSAPIQTVIAKYPSSSSVTRSYGSFEDEDEDEANMAWALALRLSP